jgi:aldehyde dehydrogenase (NAD+)
MKPTHTLFTDTWAELGLDPVLLPATGLAVHSPIDGARLAHVSTASGEAVEAAIARASAAFLRWRDVPAPRRGELVRLLGEELRGHKAALGRLVSLEAGKIESEGLGEVQEMIDICDFAVGLSRQLHGLTIASERPEHRMMEQWHPLGPVAVITAFNFPVAVWAWNAALALVCGDPVLWKPSEKTPLTALAVQGLFERAAARFGLPAETEGLSQVLVGGAAVGQRLAEDRRVALVSATGSTRMGRAVAPVVAARFGRLLLELGGNNAVIVAPSANLDLALRAIVFGAAGTAGQRCTTTRRLIVHESVKAALIERLTRAYASLPIGHPLAPGVLVGPLIDARAGAAMDAALATARDQGGRLLIGGEAVAVAGCEGGTYRRPALVEMPAQTPIVCEETFAPILYVLTYRDFGVAIALQNAVPQGLSSAVFTNDLCEAEAFLGPSGSDCGIANVNLGTSGAEIGGAFGGEKDTGGGRESGSDAWKNYMRRATNTINRGQALPLAQGVRFDI